MNLRFLLVFFLILVSLSSSAQQDTIFRNLSVSQTDEGVMISFTIRGGVTCSGLKIERSADNVNFTVIHEIEGVCGAISSDESYAITDEQPLTGGISYYRIDLGSLDLFSQTVSILYINYQSTGILVFPNPCMNSCSVYFTNPNNLQYRIRVFNNSGNLVVDENISGNAFTFPSRDFMSGIYHVDISGNGIQKYKSSIVVP